jgi:hypothetical protein
MIRPLQLGTCFVSFHHEYEPKHELNSKTGETYVVKMPKSTTVTLKTSNETVSAKAACSHKDLFNFETGRKVALRKAFSLLSKPLPKNERTRVWEEYNKLKPGGRW